MQTIDFFSLLVELENIQQSSFGSYLCFASFWEGYCYCLFCSLKQQNISHLYRYVVSTTKKPTKILNEIL